MVHTDIPPCPFVRIGNYLSGTYSITLSGNTYILTIRDLYSGWPEAFYLPSKTAENICHLLIKLPYDQKWIRTHLTTTTQKPGIGRKRLSSVESDKLWMSTYGSHVPESIQLSHLNNVVYTPIVLMDIIYYFQNSFIICKKCNFQWSWHVIQWG